MIWEALWGAELGDAVVFGIRIGGHILLEALLILVILVLLFQKSYQPPKRPLTSNEINQLVEEWVPEPLHPPVTPEMTVQRPVLESAAQAKTQVNGTEVINLSSANYLGLIGHEHVKETCSSAVSKYGVGACGPRGFYGTIDVHLDLEAKIASFLGTPDSILYSYGLATAASAIPAFCKQGDLILADKGVHWGIQNGLQLSRSTVKYFRHNDMESLKALLEEVAMEDRKKKRLNRRFIVVEAIYQNSGKMAPLNELVRLKEKHLFRLLVDESNSFGVLGRTGRGLTEHFNIPIEKVDILTAAMGCALASAGGFCTGSLKVVDHQRLSGAGYCFSASLPPFLASASIAAIELLEKDHQTLLPRLHQNISYFNQRLRRVPGITVGSHSLSPVVFIHLEHSTGSFESDTVILQRVVDQMLEQHSVLMSVMKRTGLDNCKLPAGIRVCISAAHEESHLSHVVDSLQSIISNLIP